ncbi:VanW family protein [Dyella japonica]|uniref:Glycosyltransferase involved in cell wall biosynthesis n=1 Tax=Dyella japonica TaxID=231455 RepID=A0ABV2JTP5_9GAMM
MDVPNEEEAASAQGAADWSLPTRRTRAWFWLRSRGLIARQALRNAFDRKLRRWPVGDRLADAPILFQSRSPLWTDGSDEEFILVAGKVHNLRIAAKAFHGVEVAAGACLSFWQQLGRPTGRRGFVVGREIRHGCVVPALAGGICQISNALAMAAARAGFECVERHGHTARIEQAHGDAGAADATVFWNYVDLKIRAPAAWRIELELDASELVLTLRGDTGVTAAPVPVVEAIATSPRRVARGCLTCEETTCSLHQPWRARPQRSAWLLDGHTPEFERYLRQQQEPADLFLPSLASSWRRWLPASFAVDGWAGWRAHPARRTFAAIWLRRRLWLRLWARRAGGRRQASVLDGQRWLADAFRRRLRPEHTSLIVDQALLPHLQRAGALGGRRYEVLAGALPMDEIQRRLDEAHEHLRTRGIRAEALEDFRVNPRLIAAEHAAMRGAACVVTAHAEVAAYWRERGLRVHRLPWELPAASRRSARTVQGDVPLIVLAASALARKGVHELVEALRGWRCRLLVLGSQAEDAALWQGLDIAYASYASDWIARADVVVLPAHVEHSPRGALLALAHGVPVLASRACGLEGVPGVTSVPAGDVDALRHALQSVLAVHSINGTMPSDSLVSTSRTVS